MKIYKIEYRDNLSGVCLQWAGSQRDAKRIAREILRHIPDQIETPPEISTVIIDTRKAGLIEWLNNHLATDNG